MPQKITHPDQFQSPLMGHAYDGLMTTGRHNHKRGQLMYCAKGCFELIADQRLFLVSPAFAIWLPSNLEHDVRSPSHVSYRSLYMNSRLCSQLPKVMTMIHVSPLLQASIQRACEYTDGYAKTGPEQRINAVIIDEIRTATSITRYLPLSDDERIQSLYQTIITHLDQTIGVNELAKHLHCSTRTLNRLCHDQLGMSCERWRLQIKLLKAIELISSNKRTTQISAALGYNSDSAFIEMFKAQTGLTPSQFKLNQTLSLD